MALIIFDFFSLVRLLAYSIVVQYPNRETSIRFDVIFSSNYVILHCILFFFFHLKLKLIYWILWHRSMFGQFILPFSFMAYPNHHIERQPFAFDVFLLSLHLFGFFFIEMNALFLYIFCSSAIQLNVEIFTWYLKMVPCENIPINFLFIALLYTIFCFSVHGEILQFNNFGLVGFIEFVFGEYRPDGSNHQQGGRGDTQWMSCWSMHEFWMPPATGWWIASYEKRQEIKLDLVLHQLQHIKSS